MPFAQPIPKREKSILHDLVILKHKIQRTLHSEHRLVTIADIMKYEYELSQLIDRLKEARHLEKVHNQNDDLVDHLNTMLMKEWSKSAKLDTETRNVFEQLVCLYRMLKFDLQSSSFSTEDLDLIQKRFNELKDWSENSEILKISRLIETVLRQLYQESIFVPTELEKTHAQLVTIHSQLDYMQKSGLEINPIMFSNVVEHLISIDNNRHRFPQDKPHSNTIGLLNKCIKLAVFVKLKLLNPKPLLYYKDLQFQLEKLQFMWRNSRFISSPGTLKRIQAEIDKIKWKVASSTDFVYSDTDQKLEFYTMLYCCENLLRQLLLINEDISSSLFPFYQELQSMALKADHLIIHGFKSDTARQCHVELEKLRLELLDIRRFLRDESVFYSQFDPATLLKTGQTIEHAFMTELDSEFNLIEALACLN